MTLFHLMKFNLLLYNFSMCTYTGKTAIFKPCDSMRFGSEIDVYNGDDRVGWTDKLSYVNERTMHIAHVGGWGL